MTIDTVQPSTRGAGPSLPTDLVAEYAAARPASRRLFEQAQQLFPGGETRAVTHFAPFPTIVLEGHGSRLLDADGHSYLDLVNNYTSLVHGNAYPPITEAIAAAAATGTAFASMHPAQMALVDALIGRVPAMQSMRLTNSGSEASALALRIARHATGRRVLVVLEGSYHGAVPPFTSDEPEVRTLPFGQLDAVDALIDDDVAAVFAEPFLGAGGVIEVPAEYLRALRERARQVGAVFVIDEVQSLRNEYAGMGARLDLDADLVTVAKVIGGGLPIGGVGGRRELLDLTSPLRAGRITHSGTFNGHVVAAAAGLVSVEHLTESAIDRMNAGAATLSAAIERAGAAAGFPVRVTRAGSILNVHPGGSPVPDPQAAKRHRTARAALHLALLGEGVYTSTRGMINLSTVLTDAELENAALAYERAFRRLAPDAAMLLTDDDEQ